MVAIVNVFNESNNFYLHEVGLIEKGNSAFKTGTVKNGTPSAELPSIYSLLRKLQNVNYNNQFQDRENQIYSDNFKKWFGDWENNPQSASKVVDENGEPLVVYHGTDKDFSVFNKNRIGTNYRENGNNELGGFFFTDKKASARFYSGEYSGSKESKVFETYLQIINPYESY